MKKLFNFSLIFILLVPRLIYSERKPYTTEKIIIVGGIIGGIEIINGVINLFKGDKEKQEEMNKGKEIENLLSGSKLLSMLSSKTEYIALKKEELEISQDSVEKTNLEIKKKQRVGEIDYYEVGVAYYKVGKFDKAREYLLHSIAIGVREEEAIEFLIKHFDMTRKEIQIEKRKYKKLNKD